MVAAAMVAGEAIGADEILTYSLEINACHCQTCHEDARQEDE